MIERGMLQRYRALYTKSNKKATTATKTTEATRLLAGDECDPVVPAPVEVTPPVAAEVAARLRQ